MAEQAERKTTVFISYSRRNKEFAKKLNDSLDNSGIDAWVDWEGIPLSSDWMDEITRAIEAADAFLFIISPDSLASEVCADELKLGLQYNKKLIPILFLEPEKGQSMHETLAATNWVYMREQDDYEGTLPGLIESIHTDLGWVRQHTRLLQRAKEWESKNRGNSFLLHGADLSDAEEWMVDAADQDGREVVPLQAEYIQASRQLATKRQRNLLIGVSLALVVSIGMAIMALMQKGIADQQRIIAQENEAIAHENEAIAQQQTILAQENEAIANEQRDLAKKNEAEALAQKNQAQAQRAAAEARIYQTEAGQLNKSTLLAIDSWKRTETFLAEDILRRNLSISAIPVVQVSQTGRIQKIERSPDGKYFATASEDGSVCLWSTDAAEQKLCVQDDFPVYDVVFTNEGDRFVTAGYGGVVRIWNFEDGAELNSYDYSETLVWDLDLSPDGSKLAVGRDDGIVTLISMNNPDAPVQNWEHGSAVYKAVFSPNGQWLGVGTSSGESYVWDVENVFFYVGATHKGEIYTLDFSPDSQWMATGGTDSVVRSTKVGDEDAPYGVMTHGDWVEYMVFSPSGNWFVSASDDNNLRIWDVETGTEKFRMPHDDFVLKAAISDNGGWVVSTGYDNTARVWNAASGNEMLQISLDARGTALQFNEEGTRLLIGDSNGNLTLWDTSVLLARLNYIEFSELIRGVRYSPTGELFAVNTDLKDVTVFPVDTLLSVRTEEEGQQVLSVEDLTYDLLFSSDGKWVAAAESRNNRAVLYNIETESALYLDHGAKVYGFDFSPDNTQMVTAGGDKMLRFWDLSTGEEIYSLENPASTRSAVYHPNGKHLATGVEGKIIVWDLETKTQVFILEQAGSYDSLIYSPDGTWLAGVSSVGAIYLWRVENNYALSENALLINGGEPYALAFSPDSKMLAGGSTNKFAYLWDVELGEEVARIPHSDVVRSISFSPDGLELATAARKTVQIWDIPALHLTPTDALLDDVCSHLIYNLSPEEWAAFYPEDDHQLLCPALPVKEE